MTIDRLDLLTRRGFFMTGVAATMVPFLPGVAHAAAATDGTLTIGSAVDITEFDPYSQMVNDLLMLKTVNAWLIEYDEDLKPIPSALESFEIADDSASVVLKMRTDVVFHTGKTMTVDDLVFAVERAMDPKRGFNLFAAASTLIDKIETVDDKTIKLVLKQPTATSLITDMLVHQPVIDKDHNSAEGLAGAPASAGPYKVVDWRQGESLTLEAFPEYFGKKPVTPKLVFRFFTSPAAATNALASGAIDILAYPQPRDASLLKGKFEIISDYPGAAQMLLRVSTKTAPFDNKILRQALQRAINRDRIVKEVLYDFGGPAYLPFGRNSPVQDSSVTERVGYDLEKTKELLSQVPELKSGKAMVSGSDPVSQLVMQIIQADLASVGFDLQIEQVETTSFNTRLVAGEFGVALGQVGGGQLSVPRIVQNSLMRTSNNPLWPDGNPPKAYSDAILALLGPVSEDKAKELYGKLRDVLIDESWAIGTYEVPTLWAYKSDLKGLARDHQNALVLQNAGF